MAALDISLTMKRADATLAAIDAAVLQAADDGMRPHLGASQIGKPCDRALWYGFRWAKKPAHPARLLRLFARGQREEDVLSSLLRAAGIHVRSCDPVTGKQFSFSEFGGHYAGSMDGYASNVPEAPKTIHVVEYKTHSAKSFNDLESKGVKESKPEHFAQMQQYMAWSSSTRALYVAVCKDDDRLHIERIDADPVIIAAVAARAERIIFAQVPPDGISTDPSYYLCKFCDYSAICHGTDAPQVTCRSCCHATPEREGTGRWSCARVGADSDIPIHFQKEGCDQHRYIPALLASWTELVDASEPGNWIEYRNTLTGNHFCNSEGSAQDYRSSEIHAAADKRLIGDTDPIFVGMREEVGARIVEPLA